MTCKIWLFIIGIIIVSFNFFQATNGLPLNSSEEELVNIIEKLHRQKRDFDRNTNNIDATGLYIGIAIVVILLVSLTFYVISISLKNRGHKKSAKVFQAIGFVGSGIALLVGCKKPVEPDSPPIKKIEDSIATVEIKWFKNFAIHIGATFYYIEIEKLRSG